MTIRPFKYYLHDGYNGYERAEFISEQTGVEIEVDGELYDKMGRPFYEVKLNCTLDDETGEVTIVSVG